MSLPVHHDSIRAYLEYRRGFGTPMAWAADQAAAYRRAFEGRVRLMPSATGGVDLD